MDKVENSRIQGIIVDNIIDVFKEKEIGNNINDYIQYLYENSYMEYNRIKNILYKKAKRITLKELLAIAYALDVSITEFLK